ncbi:MAG TPA: hypothetical protein VHX59_20555 [Mycobacteriales bacterium]|nr:hypothetical protein [Mycobacteriales bacterium]
MSYDIALLPRIGAERLEDTIARLPLDEDCDLDPKLVAGWRDLENNARRVVRGLRTTSLDPSCHELTDDRTGITVSAEHYVTVSIPFWYDGDQRLEMLTTLLRLATQLEADTGLAGHDLQVKRWLADGVTPAEAAAAYQLGRDTIAEPQQHRPAADSGRMGHGIIRFFSWSLDQRRRKRGST